MNLNRPLRVLCVVLCLSLAGVAPMLAQTTEKRTVDGLIYDLKHPEADRKISAAKALGNADAHQAVPPLIELTDDSANAVRLEALKALVKINDTRALAAYIKLTRDPDLRIQKLSVDGIVTMYVVPETGFVQDVKKVGRFLNPLDDGFNSLVVESYIPVSTDAVTAIGDLLFHKDRGLREQAAEALGILKAAEAVPTLGDALSQEADDGVKVELIRAVYKIGDPAGGEAVRPFIRDADKKVHDEAIYAMGALKTTAAVPQLNELYAAGVEERRKVFGVVPVSGTDDLQKKVLEALAKIGDPSSKALFEDAMSSDRDYYRRYGAEGLGRIEDDTFLTLIARKYLREKSKSVRLAMSYALYRLGRTEHLEELVLASTGDQALGYLLELTPTELEEIYANVRSESDSVKVRLLEVLGLRGGRTALPVAEELAAHDKAEVASAATLAIRRLRGRYPGS